MGVTTNLWVLSLLGIIVNVQTNSQDQFAIPKEPVYFDHFVFSQIWPPTIWPIPNQEAIGNCNQNLTNQWMIHGLWPGKFHTLDVQYCENNSIFDPTSIDSITTEMKMKWLECMPMGNDEPLPLWKHEWKKHGTCSTSLEILNTQEKYFKKSLELQDSYNMNNLLKKANILPGNYYSVEAILDGVGQILGKRCMVYCGKKDKAKSHFAEVLICFDKSLNLVHCDEAFFFPTTCTREKDIYYPEYPPNHQQWMNEKKTCTSLGKIL